MIVLIALVGWKEPIEAQFVAVPPDMPGTARYASLWVSQDKASQQMTNTVFTFYAMSISYEIVKTPRLSNELFSQYDGVATFRADMHNVFIQACAYDKHACWKFPYVVTQEDILTVVQQWLAEWMKDVGTKPSIPVPPVTDVGAGPTQMQQHDPLKESEEQKWVAGERRQPRWR